jgi:hypothetical protein
VQKTSHQFFDNHPDKINQLGRKLLYYLYGMNDQIYDSSDARVHTRLVILGGSGGSEAEALALASLVARLLRQSTAVIHILESSRCIGIGQERLAQLQAQSA